LTIVQVVTHVDDPVGLIALRTADFPDSDARVHKCLDSRIPRARRRELGAPGENHPQLANGIARLVQPGQPTGSLADGAWWRMSRQEVEVQPQERRTMA